MIRWLFGIIALIAVHSSMAQEASSGKFFALRLKPHEDLRSALLAFAAEHQLKAAAVVTCVGSLEKAVIRLANQPGATTYEGFFEIVSLTGTIDGPYAHLHLSIADSTGKVWGGHLLEGSTVYTTAELVLVELTDLEFTREPDPTYGYRELTIRKRKKP